MDFHFKFKHTGNDEDIVTVYFYNMRKNRQQGFKKLKLFTDNNKKVFAIVCGGDGTVMWVVS